MWHKMNGVQSRGSRGPAPRPTFARSPVPRRARIGAMVVSCTCCWLLLAGLRSIFEAGLELLPDDGDYFAMVYGAARRPPAVSGDGASNGGNSDRQLWALTGGERFTARLWGVAVVCRALLGFCATFGGSPPTVFRVLALFNVLVVWVLGSALWHGALAVSLHTGMVSVLLLVPESASLLVLADTNGVYEDSDSEDEDDDKHKD